MFNLFLAVSPEIFIINATFILLIHGVVFSTSKKDDYPPLVSNVGWLGLLSVLITLLLLAAGAPLLTIAHLFRNNLFRRDNFTYFCQILLLLSTAGTISMCFDSSEQERFDASEFIVLIPLPTRSMLFMISAHDSIAMYLAIEPQSLCFYVMAASKRKSEFSTEAGSKYLILGAFPSGILLFGFTLFQTVDFSTIFARASAPRNSWISCNMRLNAITLICILLLIGAVGKSAQIGSHTWSPDAMEGPTPVSALIHAATMVTAGVFMIARCSPLFEYPPTALIVITSAGATTSFLAATTGILQNDLKRVIAYSTCSQLGYMIFACGISNYSVSVFHLMNHAFFKALLFLSAGSVIHAMSDEQDMRKMGGLASSFPFTYAMMLMGSLSLIGFPFLTGFYSKFYYIRLAKRMFFDTPRTWILYEPMDRDKSLLLAMTSSFITSSFPYPSPLFSVTHQMALSSYL
uniref:NADH dehydrogenase subunit 2 n=1 Tax=Sophora flavescens TaxID=49840 RepID=A0A4Y5UYW6_SOPFL|nr:NADH dehydrogenase subunit 2 [Sophora flavescens]QDD68237.1 NADH dehydrogenase subunit 2 [Sophora flavescens]